MLLSLLGLVHALLHLQFKTDRDDLVRPAAECRQCYQAFQREFGEDLDLVWVVAGADRDRIIRAVEALGREIEARPDRFQKVCYRARTERLRAKGLQQLGVDQLAGIEQRLVLTKPLLLLGWRWLTLENVLQATLTAPSAEGWKNAAKTLDSLHAWLHVGQQAYASPWDDAALPKDAAAPKDDVEYFFSPSGRMAFILAAPSLRSDTFLGPTETVAAARAVMDRVATAFPGLEFGLTGLPVLEHDEMHTALSGSATSAVLSSAAVVALVLVVFRAASMPLAAALCLAIAGGWALGGITLTVGHLNILTVSFAVTLIGLGMDYGIVWIGRWMAARERGASVTRSLGVVTNEVGPSIFSGAATTMAAFLATCFTGFRGLIELGWIAAFGVGCCLIAVFTVLPALATLLSRQRHARAPAPRTLIRIGPMPARTQRVGPGVVVAAGGLLTAVLAVLAPLVPVDFNLLHLQAKGTPSVEWEHRLLEEVGSSGWYALAMADSPAEAAALRRRFESLPTVGRVVEFGSLMPTDVERKAPIIARIRGGLSALPEVGAAAARVPAVNKAALTCVLDQLSAAPNPGNDPKITSVKQAAERLRSLLGRQTPDAAAASLDGYQRKWSLDLLVQLHQLRSAADPAPLTAEDLPASLRQRYVSPSGKWLLQIFSRDPIWEMHSLRAFCDDVRRVDPQASGKPITAIHALDAMTTGFQRSAVLALVFVLLLLRWDFGSLVDALLAMVPLVLGIVSMFGLMTLTGLALNPANLIALPLIVGVGVDYGVHVLHEHRRAPWRGAPPLSLVRAVGCCWATSLASFLSLAATRHWGMISIGLVLGIGVTCCFLQAVVFLPALLQWRTTPAPAALPAAPASSLARAA